MLNTHSKIFFNTISKNEKYEDYRNKFLHFRTREYLNDLLSQVFINSKTASRKYEFYRWGLGLVLVLAG